MEPSTTSGVPTPTASVPTPTTTGIPTPPSFLAFRDMCLGVLSQSGNCQDSRDTFSSASSVSDLANRFKRFWQGLCEEVPLQVIACFETHYPAYRDDIRAAGISYNEPHPDPGAFIIIGSGTHDLDSSFVNHQRISILGPATVTLRGNSRAYINNPDAVVIIRNHTHATISRGTVHVRDRSVCTCAPLAVVHTYDSATLYTAASTPAVNGTGFPTIIDHGHLRIYR